MPATILTSMFERGFPQALVSSLDHLLPQNEKRNRFAFVASEFQAPDSTDSYFHHFYQMFLEKGLVFQSAYVVDSRMTPKQAQQAVAEADAVWLSGGDTPKQYAYLKEYGLIEPIRQHPGVVIGMSAGTLNLARTTICTQMLGHAKQEIYPGIGAVDITVESHFQKEQLTEEVIGLSNTYPIYEMCDESFIVCHNGEKTFYGEIYRLENGILEKIISLPI